MSVSYLIISGCKTQMIVLGNYVVFKFIECNENELHLASGTSTPRMADFSVCSYWNSEWYILYIHNPYVYCSTSSLGRYSTVWVYVYRIIHTSIEDSHTFYLIPNAQNQKKKMNKIIWRRINSTITH